MKRKQLLMTILSALCTDPPSFFAICSITGATAIAGAAIAGAASSSAACYSASSSAATATTATSSSPAWSPGSPSPRSSSAWRTCSGGYSACPRPRPAPSAATRTYRCGYRRTGPAWTNISTTKQTYVDCLLLTAIITHFIAIQQAQHHHQKCPPSD